MNFNSQICTTQEQSERLFALGLKKETADMEIHSFKDDEQETFETGYANKGYMEPEFAEIVDCFPAWSLHRLMCLCPDKLGSDDGGERASWDMYAPDEYELQISQTGCQYLDDDARYGGERLNYFYENGNIYDALISCIEWLIKEGYFNKEYLEE